MWELYIKFVKLIVVTNFFGCFISTYASSKIIGHFDVNYVIHMTKISWVVAIASWFKQREAKFIINRSLPWDQTTYAGYLAEDFLICMFALTFCIGTGIALLLFISICIHQLAFYEMFKHSIENWNNWNQSEQNRNGKPFISDLIYFHADVKELVNQSKWRRKRIPVNSYFHKLPISGGYYSQSKSTVHFSWFKWLASWSWCQHQHSTLIWYLRKIIDRMTNEHECNHFLQQLQQSGLSMENPPYNLITILAQATFGMVNLFIYCFFGKMTTENFAKMPDYIYFELKWDRLPGKLRTYIPLMIQNMQKPVFYHGFDVVVMDLNTFLQVS